MVIVLGVEELTPLILAALEGSITGSPELPKPSDRRVNELTEMEGPFPEA